MKNIFEKIIIDSVENIADGIINEIQSRKNSTLNRPLQKDAIITDKPQDDTYQQSDAPYYSETRNNHNEQNANTMNDDATSTRTPSSHDMYTMESMAQSNKINVINTYSRNKRLNIMIICAALGLALCMLILISYKEKLPGEVVGIVSTVSGIFGACLKDAYSFEFGSSRGSKEKDEKISAAILERLKK